MYPSNYDTGFPQGLTIRNIPVEIAQNGNSNIFWVNSAVGSNGNQGNFLHPFATLAYAITRCTANQGDIIYIAAGHSEDIIAASGILLNIAGVTIKFLGEGSNRGTINFTTIVSASLSITAANVTLINPRFVAGFDALTAPISITASNCSIINGSWYDTPAMAATDCIVATTAATGLTIKGWKYYASTTGTQKKSNIKLTAVSNVVLQDIDINGDFLFANINNATTECTDLRLQNLYLKNSNVTPEPVIILQANTTGMAKNVDLRIVSGTTFVSNVAKMNWDAQCLGYHADGQTGTPIATYS